MDFEIHITIAAPCNRANLEFNVMSCDHRWTISNITDDPLLGPGDKTYLTAHDTDYSLALYRMNSMFSNLKDVGFNPIRKKIELIMLDERT